MKTKLEISVPGEVDRHVPIDTRAIIGKGPTADVSLDVPGITAQHFRVKLGPSDVDLRLAPGARPLTYEGRPFSGGVVPYGADFYLDRVRFSCVRPKEGSQSKVLPLLLGTLVVVIAVFGFVLAQRAGIQTNVAANEQDIALFPEAPACAAPDPASAARKALNLERAAQTKRERYRYDAHDGLDAGRLYAEAARCYQAAGDTAGRQRVDQEGGAWRQRVSEEFRAARLRLQMSMQEQDWNAALNATVAMRKLLEGEPMPYNTYLANTERQLRIKLQPKKRAGKPF